MLLQKILWSPVGAQTRRTSRAASCLFFYLFHHCISNQNEDGWDRREKEQLNALNITSPKYGGKRGHEAVWFRWMWRKWNVSLLSISRREIETDVWNRLAPVNDMHRFLCVCSCSRVPAWARSVVIHSNGPTRGERKRRNEAQSYWSTLLILFPNIRR